MWPFRFKIHHLFYQFFFMIDLARSIVGVFLINMMEQGMLSKILRIVVELVFLILIGVGSCQLLESHIYYNEKGEYENPKEL